MLDRFVLVDRRYSFHTRFAGSGGNAAREVPTARAEIRVGYDRIQAP